MISRAGLSVRVKPPARAHWAFRSGPGNRSIRQRTIGKLPDVGYLIARAAPMNEAAVEAGRNPWLRSGHQRAWPTSVHLPPCSAQ